MKNVREIVHPSDLDVLQNAISEKQLVEKAEMPFLTFIEVISLISLFIFTYIYNYLSLGQYDKQPSCTWDARSKGSAQRRGKTVQPTLDVRIHTCSSKVYLQTYHLKTLGESGRGGSFACFWEWGANYETLCQKIILPQLTLCPMQVGYAVAHKKNATLVTILPGPLSVAPLKWGQIFLITF